MNQLYRDQIQQTQKKLQVSAIPPKKIFFALILLFFIALVFVRQRLECIKLEKKLTSLETIISELKVSILPLEVDLLKLTELKKIEKIAKNDLHLKPVKSKQRTLIKVITQNNLK